MRDGAVADRVIEVTEEAQAGAYDSAGFGSTKDRMAFALARLRKSENLTEEAEAFAAYGLCRVGSASLLRPELEALAAQA